MTSRLQYKEKQLVNVQSLNVVFSHCCITYDDFCASVFFFDHLKRGKAGRAVVVGIRGR